MKPTHSLPVVFMSVAIAVVAAYAALVLAGRIGVSHGRERRRWLAGGALALGGGVWSMHFVAMLAFRLPLPVAHDVPDTIISLLVAVGASLLALDTASRAALTFRRLAAAGLVMGGGIAAMHYIGMAGLVTPARIHYDALRVALSLLIAVGASLAALWVAFHLRDPEGRRPEWQLMAAALVLGSAIAGMHYTGVSAIRFEPTGAPGPASGEHLLGNAELTAAVTLASVGILLVAVFSALMDRRARTHAGTILERIADSFLTFDQEGHCTFANQAAETLLHRPRSAMLGCRLAEFGLAHEGSPLEQACLSAMREQVPSTVETLASSTQRWLEVRIYPSPAGLSVYIRDVTERHESDQALRLREQQLAEAQRIAQLGSWECRTDADHITWSDEMYRLFGHEPNDFVPTVEGYLSMVHPEDRERTGAVFLRAERTHEPFALTQRIVRPDGEVRVIHCQGGVMPGGEGEPARFAGTCQDVTERTEAEQRLRQANGMVDAVVQSSPLAVVAVDTEGLVTLWNPAAERMFGWTGEEVLGREIPVIPADEGQPLSDLLKHGGSPRAINLREVLRRRRDGSLLDVSLSAAPVLSASGTTTGAVAIIADITAERAASQALRVSEERFRELAETVREVFWIRAPGDGAVLYVSPAAEQVWNVAPELLMGDPSRLMAMVHPDDREAVIRARAAGEQDSVECEYRIVRPDGVVRWVRDRGFPVRDAAGVVVRVVGIAEDVTARREKDEAVRTSEAQAQKMAERMRAVAGAAGATIDARSPAALRDVLAEAARRVIASDMFTFALLQDDGETLADLGGGGGGNEQPRLVQVEGTPCEGVIRGRQSLLTRRATDPEGRGPLWGTTIPSESGIRTPIVSGGEVLGLISVQSCAPERYDEQDVEVFEALAALAATALRNIRLREEQDTAQEALRQSEADYRGLFENAHDAIIILQPGDERVLDVNPRACTMYGYPRERFVGMTMEAVSVDVEAGRARVRDTLETDVMRHFDLVQRMADGEQLHVEVIATPVPYRGGTAILSINRDITARKAAEDALRESELRFRSVTQSAADAIVTTDSAGCIVSWNRGAETIFGYREAEVLGQGLEVVMPRDAREHDRAEAECRGELSMRGPAIESTGVRRDGTEFPLEASLALWEAGGRCFATRIMRDVSERRRAEEELQRSQEKLAQAQKMEAVGRLAGGVAHDFNNLLTVIGGNADLLLLDHAGDRALCEDLGEIRDAAERAAALTRQLLAFSRQQVLQPRLLDLDIVVSSVYRLLSRLIPESVDVVLRLDGALPAVRADPTQMEQVILNLAVNARDAMPDGGRMVIRTRAAEMAKPETRAGFELPAGTYVVLSITDTGQGIGPGLLGRIFEPFFTTKAEGHGTGLGLATVYGIVQQSGGYIDVASEPGKGTRFDIFLPRVAAEVDSSGDPAAVPRTQLPQGTGTVLLVEDNAAVRSVGSRALARSGYTVLDAGDGVEGLAVAAGYPGRLDVVVTDVVMPRMGGRELARRLSEMRPETRVIFTSGFTEDSVLRPETFEPGAHFLPKPYGPGDLLQRVRSVLAEA